MKKFFLGLAKTMLHIGTTALPVVVASVNPALAPFVSAIVNAVLQAEATHGSGTGEQKKELVMSIVDIITPIITQNHPIKNEARYKVGVDKLIDGIVDILSSVGVLKDKEV
jgi:hypothetical protein